MPARMKITIGAILFSLLCSEGVALAEKKVLEKQLWPRDPFRYTSSVPPYPTEGLPEYGTGAGLSAGKGLSGIFVSNGVYRALYGGRLVRTGDRVGSAWIREITLYAVVVDDGTERRRIELFHEK